MGTSSWIAHVVFLVLRTSVRACGHWLAFILFFFKLLLKCVRAAGVYACVWLIGAYHTSEFNSGCRRPHCYYLSFTSLD